MAKINISIELNDGETLDDAVAQIKGSEVVKVAVPAKELVTDNPEAEPKKATKKKAATPPPAEEPIKPKPTPEPVAEEKPVNTAGPESETPTLEELRAILTPVMKDNKAAIKEKLTSFGAKNLSELAENDANMLEFFNWAKSL